MSKLDTLFKKASDAATRRIEIVMSSHPDKWAARGELLVRWNELKKRIDFALDVESIYITEEIRQIEEILNKKPDANRTKTTSYT